MPMGCMAVVRNSHWRWLSCNMQGGTRRKDSYTGHSLPSLWHKGSPRVNAYLRINLAWMSTPKQDLSSAMVLEVSIRIPKLSPTETEEDRRETRIRTLPSGAEKWEKKKDCSSGTSDFAHGTVQQSTDGVLSWCWPATLLSFACKKQGHAQVGHWHFKSDLHSHSEASRLWYADSSAE